jgi:hypothetical protein
MTGGIFVSWKDINIINYQNYYLFIISVTMVTEMNSSMEYYSHMEKKKILKNK